MPHDSDTRLVHTSSLGECWLASIATVLQNGQTHHDEDVEIRELLGLTVHISEPKTHDPLIDAFGDRAVINRTLAKFAKGAEMPDRPFTYGACIYSHDGINQFEWLVGRLQAKRETKSATICLLTAGSRARNLPCLTTLDAKIRDARLELQFLFRSQNIFGRQYANLLALARLQAELATRCDVATGGLRGYIASAHIYSFDVIEARRILSGDCECIEDRYYQEGPASIRC
ncbi:MAG: hypothetical protein KFB96_02890 [Thiocapsa sp.]|uniref:thymidylate synthase n=1 Tax=Thiocapsa sp. TaxID=2024551 RepID=UPI001BCBEE4D|nr:thymidylate synthase [Thiocapsa sp.]QVL49482.1 MAG: hypothetical protein KFB96_02890 [Thiocapsa sp.]